MVITTRAQGQPCTLQFLPALQIITMLENTQPGNLVARLQITGTSSEISTRLIYNSSDVKTNGTDYFILDFTDLYLQSPLDYEWWTSNNYPNPFRFIVECTVLADQSIHDIDFQLDLIDVNDNPPIFSQSIYYISLLETTPINTIISTAISAHDPDSGVAGTFSYYLHNNLSSYNSYFRLISPTNASLILVQPLNYNTMLSNFNVTIVAQDNGTPSLSSQAIISMHLIDVDNLDPKFNVSISYYVNISIDTGVGSEIIPNEGRIYAYDQDIGINATIIYSLLTSNNYILINRSTGVLTLFSKFQSITQFDLLVKAEQDNNPNRSVTTVLHINIYELNLCAPRFLALPYTMIGYTTNNMDQIPTFNGTVDDMDTNPRLTYGYSCNSSLINLDIIKTSLRQFRIQLNNFLNLPKCQPCICYLNVSDGRHYNETNLNVYLYTPISFLMNSYLFSVDYPLNDPSIIIGSISVIKDDRCQVQYFILDQHNSLFSISSTGSLTWLNTSNPPTQEAYQLQIVVQQICSSLIMNISTDIIITIRNFPSHIITSTINTSQTDNSTTYAIIASVSAFILIIIAILFIIIYYNIQRAKHRVPPFFKTRQNSAAHGLSFFKSKSPINESSPYTLGVRDDDSSHSSDQTTSSPVNNRLLSGHYKVSEPPISTTIEELLSTYDNRSTSSSSSSSGVCDQPVSPNIGSFRTTVREANDHQTLDTINEDMQWVNQQQHEQNQKRRLHGLKNQIISEDSMDIISESHEVQDKFKKNTNACFACLNSNHSINHVCSHCYLLLSSTSTHLLLSSSSSSSSSGSTTTVDACRQQTTTATTVESSISGAGIDIGPSASTLLQQQSHATNVHSRHLNEYLTVFV
ncbi:unnamed protein product [Rotaria magnacalcarata]|uniref:Cadherin domain-containing protein n=3 Tax=Rotaria magnacalcarata TaxID=392030 RepID=A0A818WQ71_9BILA|nr:unnamed protein product [Rotaria magnacalcarata]CAF1988210.1 unnamed protein product [Rotaria magnacalcarata]CAF3729177.1 unnamed protein product [Rotaria magnacalcarata]